MTRVLPDIRSPWPRRVFVVGAGSIGLARLVAGLRAHEAEDIWAGGVLIGIAAAVGVYAFRSPEARQAKPRDPRTVLDGLPIPSVVRSTGSRLAVRLGKTGNYGLGAIVVPVLAVLVNGVAWPATCAASPADSGWFLWIGLGGIVLAVAAIATVSAWVGARKAPVVEISREPVAPGGTFELSVLQHGPATIIVYEVKLVCLERTQTLDRKHNQTFEHVVSEQTLIAQTAMIVGRDEPWSHAHTLTIPEDAMHSFSTRGSDIIWQFVVRAEIDGRPDFELNYPFRVLPALPGRAA
jgi:hypothetical protein